MSGYIRLGLMALMIITAILAIQDIKAKVIDGRALSQIPETAETR